MYKVDLGEAERQSTSDYESFQDYFTRELKSSARPIDAQSTSIISPVDGTVAVVGQVDQDTAFQAKGLNYSIESLLQNPEETYRNAQYTTIYLAPSNYHRIHVPLASKLVGARAIKGSMFPVNDAAVSCVPDLFARNVRLVCYFESASGPYVMVLVGALVVAGIELTWPGPNTPYKTTKDYSFESIEFKKGAELARFTLGSTVILLMPTSTGDLSQIAENDVVRFGQSIGTTPLV